MFTNKTQSINQLESDIMYNLNQAVAEFKKVNHLRGLTQSYKGMREEMREKTELMGTAALQAVTKTAEQEFDAKYIEHSQLFRRACDESRDLCISRIAGEDFSLLIEIVRSKKVQSLFDKYETAQLGGKLAPVAPERKSQGNEGKMEAISSEDDGSSSGFDSSDGSAEGSNANNKRGAKPKLQIGELDINDDSDN